MKLVALKVKTQEASFGMVGAVKKHETKKRQAEDHKLEAYEEEDERAVSGSGVIYFDPRLAAVRGSDRCPEPTIGSTRTKTDEPTR